MKQPVPATPLTLRSSIDSIGNGPFQLVSTLICGSVWFFHGAFREISKISYTTHISSSPTSFLSLKLLLALSLCFGCVIAYVSLPHIGRRACILLGTCLVGFTCYCASMASSPTGIVLQLSFTHVALGMALPVTAMYVGETSAAGRGRALLLSALVGMNILGDIFVRLAVIITESGVIDSSCNKDSLCHLQVLLEMVSVPIILGAIAAGLMLLESPFALMRDVYALNSNMRMIATWNRSSGAPSTFVPSTVEEPNEMVTSRSEKSVGLVLGLLMGGIEVFLSSSYSPKKEHPVSLLCVFLAITLLPILLHDHSLVAVCGLPFVMVLVACVGLAVENPSWDWIFFALLKSTAFTLVVMVLVAATTSRHTVDESLVDEEECCGRLIAAPTEQVKKSAEDSSCWESQKLSIAFALSSLFSSFVPSFLPLSLLAEEIAVAILFSLTGLLAATVLSRTYWKKPDFEKIHIISHKLVR